MYYIKRRDQKENCLFKSQRERINDKTIQQLYKKFVILEYLYKNDEQKIG